MGIKGYGILVLCALFCPGRIKNPATLLNLDFSF
jgi:hypothetical protein